MNKHDRMEKLKAGFSESVLCVGFVCSMITIFSLLNFQADIYDSILFMIASPVCVLLYLITQRKS